MAGFLHKVRERDVQLEHALDWQRGHVDDPKGRTKTKMIVDSELHTSDMDSGFSGDMYLWRRGYMNILCQSQNNRKIRNQCMNLQGALVGHSAKRRAAE